MSRFNLWRTVSVRRLATRRNPDAFLMVFTCGLPGSGKTRVLDKLYGLGNVVVLDLDQEMKRHARFDPSRPTQSYADTEAYKWADAEVEKKFQKLLVEKERLVAVDGTGTNVARTQRRMREARQSGYFTRLLHVDVSLDTAMERNRRRRRQVPYHVLEDYQAKLTTALEATKCAADEFVYVCNEDDDGLCGMKRWGGLYHKYYADYSLPPDDMGHTVGDPKMLQNGSSWLGAHDHENSALLEGDSDVIPGGRAGTSQLPDSSKKSNKSS